MADGSKDEQVSRARASGALVSLIVFAVCALLICGFLTMAAMNENGWGAAGLGLALIYVSFRMRSTLNEWMEFRIRAGKKS